MESKKKVLVLLYRKNSQQALEVLALRRVPQRGGFWQPVTGNVEAGESLENAALREVKEETNISSILQTIDLGLNETFVKNELTFIEHAFAMEVDYSERISLESNPSKEHCDSIWISYDGAFEMFNFPHQRDALNKLFKHFYS